MQSSNVIVFASQKGGSGKTTLSGHLAVQADLSGAGPVAVIDTDPQRNLAHWRYRREENTPILKVSDVDNVEGDIAEMRSVGARTIIIDTPPAATSAIGEVIRHADLVCIPTRPSPHDLRAVGATIDIAEMHRKPIVFVLNSAAARAKITSEAAMALAQHGTVAPTIVHNRVDFAASMTDGRTVTEADQGSRSAQEIATLWNYIGERLGRIHGQRGLEAPLAAAATVDAAPSVPAAAQAEEAPAVRSEAPEGAQARPQTPTAEEFFAQRRMIKTPTYFGPDRRRQDRGGPGGIERRAATFGRRKT